MSRFSQSPQIDLGCHAVIERAQHRRLLDPLRGQLLVQVVVVRGVVEPVLLLLLPASHCKPVAPEGVLVERASPQRLVEHVSVLVQAVVLAVHRGHGGRDQLRPGGISPQLAVEAQALSG